MLKLDTKKSEFYIFSNSYKGIIESHHLLLYVRSNGKDAKLGEINSSGIGKTPEQALEDSYRSMREQFTDICIIAFIVIDKKELKNKDYAILEMLEKQHIYHLKHQFSVVFLNGIEVQDIHLEELFYLDKLKVTIMMPMMLDAKNVVINLKTALLNYPLV